MADFLESEAEESEEEHDLEPHERKRLKKQKAVSDSSEEEEEDDEERLREELKDLIDDNPIEEDGSDAEDSDGSGGSKKRKKHDDDDDIDDRLEDDDYDLIEENLGVKVERRKRFKRLRRIQDEESDGEEERVDEGLAREAIAEQLFDEDDENIERRSERAAKEPETFEEEEEETDSDADDFIVDDDGRPIAEKKKKRRPIFTDASLQEGQDIFGVDFDYDDFSKYDEEDYEDDSEADDYDVEIGEDGQEKPRKKSVKKKSTKKTIFDIYEPSELKRGHFTDLDNEIRKTDIPERMQLRQVPVTAVPEGSTELDDESEWIYKQAFCKPTVSKQDKNDNVRDKSKKPPSAIGKIKQALEFIRNQQLEVPFVAFYRKEYVKPELSTDDLWKIYYYDERWCQLLSRKNKLLLLFEKMKKFLLAESSKTVIDVDDPKSSLRLLKDEDFDRLREVQTMEELKDVHMHFLLYYSQDIPRMQEEMKRLEKEEKKRAREERKRLHALNEENAAEPLSDSDVEEEEEEQLKQVKDSGPYAMCRKAGICGLAKRFGLMPEQYAENIRDSYQRHEVQQESISHLDVARQYLCPKFLTLDEVIHAAKFVVARQLSREPLLRKAVREIFFERAKINVRPTKKGIKEIDENHPCYTMKYVSNKPVRDLVGEQFLRLVMAEEDKLIEVTISDQVEGNISQSYIDEAKQLFQRDEFSKIVQEWNALRAECVELALTKMVIPELKKELRAILLAESKDCVLKMCCEKLFNWLKIAPYKPSDSSEEFAYDEWDYSKGIRVMGLAYVPDYTQAAFGVITTPEGDVSDYIRLPHLLKRKNSYRADEKALKLSDLKNLKDFIRYKKPHVIAIGGESREAQMICQDFQDVIKELVEEDQFPSIAVEIVDNELAKIYANSKKGASDFKEYPNLLKQAVSLARKMQDPLVEYSQLCGPDEEILCLRYHTLQEQLSKEELLERLYIEFINRTNEVGIDINIAIQNSYTLNLVQFICGLGPRKGQALIKTLKQTNQRLENRTQLVTLCHLGPKVFINCSGFIKIDTSALGDSTEAYVEVLDGSRVHPETYEWARKMAIDAMEYDDEETNPAGALEEILETPERLKDLDLDAFAVELERQGFGNKSITLYDIRNELHSLYKDMRIPYRSPNPEELFDMLTKETPESFYVGKMLLATVIGISHRKPQGEQLDQANPVRNDETGQWQCPFCLKDDFPELSEVWNHFDAGACPGQATGVKLRLDNGLSGFIHIKNLSDKHVKNPEERVQNGQTIHVRIIKIDVDRFSVDCSSKSSDLMDKNQEWRPRKDPFYDFESEEKDKRKETEKKQNKKQQQYVKRVIIHPSFHNKSYAEVVKIMENMDQGEVIVRPSSKGSDHLTVTWKVTTDIYQHIDVREEGKENAFSLGQSLWIGNEEFEDLDEIIARYVNPMAACARELLGYKYYRDSGGGNKEKLEEMLREEKQKDPKKIHYFMSASKAYPGKFLLSYLPKTKVKHEYVSVIPEGFRFRGNVFESLNSFLKWFKDHYSDPIVSSTPVSATPHAQMSVRTSNYDTPRGSSDSGGGGINQVPAIPVQTPQYPNTPGYQGGTYVNTPYTPSSQTPFMTPYNTPHSSQTPRYSISAPSPTSSTPNINHFRSDSGGLGHQVKSRSHSISPRSADIDFGKGGGRPYTYQKESLEWQMAAESWARRKPNYPSQTPRSVDRELQHESRSNAVAFAKPSTNDGFLHPSHQYHDELIRSKDTRSPRSIRSTPRTNTSPHSMNLGDATPLYDEN